VIYEGDCLSVLPVLGVDSIDSVVTDPPYGLSFMGKDWDHGVPGVHFWVEALRVAKPGAYLLAFGGTRTFHRLTCAIEDAGWEIRDCVMWVYGSGFPKSHNIGNGWGTALKPAWEPIIVARKPIVGTVADNVLRYGTGAMNIDASRIPVDPICDASQLRTMNRSEKTEPNGWGMNQNGGDTPQVVNTAGRWPANLIHDGSDEVVGLFPVTNGNNRGYTPANPSPSDADSHIYGFANYPSMHKSGAHHGDSGSAARFFYCAKASKADRDEGCEGLEEAIPPKLGMPNNPEYLSTDGCRRSGFRNATRNHHPTVKPTALMRYLCRLVTPPGGTVLDPFMGSGSTGKAAALEGFKFIGIELEKEYTEIAERRIGATQPLLQAITG
jgi:DNA modification methylase